MPDPFDPAEFDTPPPSDPGTDYRTLLDAMRKAGAEGVAQQVAARSKAGLWAFADLPDPNAIILRALQRPSAAEPSSPAPVPPPSPNTPQQP